MATSQPDMIVAPAKSTDDVAAFEPEAKDKIDLEHLEVKTDPKRPDGHDVPVSPFKDMPRSKALRVFWKATAFCVLVAWAAIMDGFLISIPGSIVANKYFIKQFCTVSESGSCQLDAVYVGAFTGVQSVGQIIGMMSGPITADMFGRRFNLLLLTVILTIGVGLELIAKTNPVWLVARLFAGWGTGMVQTGVPVYISEIAPHMLRGGLIATYNFWFGVGQFAGAIALQVAVNQTGYKGPIYAQFVFIGVMAISFPFIPETPWFYLNKNQPEKAKVALKKIYGAVDGYDVNLEYRVLNYERQLQNASAGEAKSASYRMLFQGANLRRTWVSWLPLQFQGLGGLSFVLSYTTYFFQLAGVANPFLGNVIVKCIQLTAQLVSFYNIERFGRRRLLLVGGAGMTVMCLAIAVVGTPNWTPPGGLVVAFFCMWTWCYSSSCAPIGYVYLAEISTPRLRAKTAGFAASITACFGIVTNFVTPILLSAQKAGWSYKTGYLFFGLALLGWIGMFLTVPEVAGRSYEEIDELFENKTPTRMFRLAKTEVQLERERATAANGEL